MIATNLEMSEFYSMWRWVISEKKFIAPLYHGYLHIVQYTVNAVLI